MIWGMARKKQPRQIDNTWFRAEIDQLAKSGITQADMARATGISTDKLNKSAQNKRSIPLEEYTLIKKFLEDVAQKSLNLNQASTPEIGNNSPAVGKQQEPKSMSKEAGLSEDVTRDLLRRVRRLEDKIEDLEAAGAAKGPQRGRKR